MPILIKAIQFFSGLGAVATAPFAVKFVSKQEVINQRKGRKALYTEVKIEQEITPPKTLKSTEVIGEAQKLMDSESKKEGEKRCFWWPTGTARGLELLACVYMNELNKVFLFHYDAKSQLRLPKQLNPITRLAYNGAGAYMYLDDQAKNMTHHLKLVFAWLRRWEVDLLPKEHCSISRNNGNYTLACDNAKRGGKGKPFKNENISLETLYKNRHQT